MSEIIFNQFEHARSWSLDVVKSIPDDIVHIKPKGFNNNILWQIGHILASTEYFLFDLPYERNHLPANYIALFGSGTNPDHWDESVPKVAQLLTDLEEQLNRLRDISDTQLRQALANPMHGFQTIGDCAGFSVLHEALHVGKIEEMKRMLTHL